MSKLKNIINSASSVNQYSVARLDVYEGKWYELANKYKYLHKASNSTLIFYGFLEYSPMSCYHVNLLLKKYKPSKMAVSYTFQKLQQFRDRYEFGNNPYVKSESSKLLVDDMLRRLNNTIKKNKAISFDIARDYIPMKATGVPPMSDVVLWLKENKTEDLICLRKERKKLSFIDKCGNMQDRILNGMYSKKLEAEGLLFDPQVRSRLPLNLGVSNLAKEKGGKGIELKSFLNWARSQMMVFTPDEVDKMSKLMKVWKRHFYRQNVYNMAEDTNQVLLNVLENTKNSSILVCLPRLELIELLKGNHLLTKSIQEKPQ